MSDLAAHLEELERLREVRRREIDVASAALERARNALRASEDLWGARNGQPLPFVPLTAALISVICANAAAFSGWIVILGRWGDLIWDVGLVGGATLSLMARPFSKPFGAGGRARIGLRRVTIAFLLVALVEAVIATERLFRF